MKVIISLNNAILDYAFCRSISTSKHLLMYLRFIYFCLYINCFQLNTSDAWYCDIFWCKWKNDNTQSKKRIINQLKQNGDFFNIFDNIYSFSSHVFSFLITVHLDWGWRNISRLYNLYQCITHITYLSMLICFSDFIPSARRMFVVIRRCGIVT